MPEAPYKDTTHSSATNMADNIYLGEDARTKLMAGVNKVCDAVKLTLGAAGANGIIERDISPGHEITNDGISLIEAIQLTDPIERIGANLVKENSSRSNRESGDGSTTAAVLLQAILKEGMLLKDRPMDIKRSLDECVPIILESIDKQKRAVTPAGVGAVATTSAEDETMGQLIQEIYEKIGSTGIIELETSSLPETFYEIIDAVRLRGAGFMGAYSTTEPGKAIYKDPKILICKDKITSVDQLDPLVRALSAAGTNELVIYAEDMDISVGNRLALTHLQGGFKTLVIKAPTLWRDWIIEDFAKMTGATIVDAKEGKTFKNLTMADLGTCEKLVTTKDETRVFGIKDISDHVARVKEVGTDEAKIRASWLQTKAAVLKLGANSESELSYKRLKADDARNAAYHALQDGVVAGGGIALFNASRVMPETIGGNILRRALEAPFGLQEFLFWHACNRQS